MSGTPFTTMELDGVVALISLAAVAFESPRWLRVAQREHYIPRSAATFAYRWWHPSAVRINAVLFVVAVGASEFAIRGDLEQLQVVGVVSVSSLIAAFFPKGLSLSGRSSKFAVTSRVKRLMVISYLLSILLLLIGYVVGLLPFFAALLPLGYPIVVDVSMWAAQPIESRILSRFVRSAQRKLTRISPRIIAVTGSFGKTTTKNYIATLASSSLVCMATPASFNNKGGLARSINEYLADGTDLFVAEMGTFGKGEIASLCEWVRPDISVICALGPVHLERFGSEDAILEAKLEITRHSPVVVMCVDYPKLALAANELEQAGKRVWRCSARDFEAEVSTRENDDGEVIVFHNQRRIGSVAKSEIVPGNLACAVAAVLAAGVPDAAVAAQLERLRPSANRLTASVVAESGIEVLDDTYNSNPVGAKRALVMLESKRRTGRKLAVVTPGMVELGERQFSENFKFGQGIAEVADYLLIVGATNRRALAEGASSRGGKVPLPLEKIIEVRRRQQAVDWIRGNLGSGDIVLYENDLPDHFP